MSSFSTLAKFVLLAAAAAPALAHVAMDDPPPLRSAKNPQYNGASNIEYTYTNPLNKEGMDFPCKGFHVDVPSVSTAVATLNAGSELTVKLGGSAIHGGGSCQFALSYDAGVTWGVIHEIIGNCPTNDASYQVPVPADLPSAKDVLFAWTWFNKIGNREMYMNCAAVDVMGSNTGSIQLQKMFEANHFGATTCTTPEGVDVDFKNPQLDNCPADKLVTAGMMVTLGSGAPAPPSTPTKSQDPPSAPTPTDADPCPGEGEGETSSTPPTSTGTPPPSGGAGAWDAGKVYVGGDTACKDGVQYTAKWWTQGETPGGADVWTAGGKC